MNSIWPAASRISCIHSRIASKTCPRIDSLAARLIQRSFRSYSTYLSCQIQRSSQEKANTSTTIARARAQRKLGLGVRTYGSSGIVTTYEDLPDDFDPEEGLRFRARPLSREEVDAVFGSKVIDVNSANRLLAYLHAARVAGTLEDPKTLAHLNPVQRKARDDALQWLRKHVPVNEVHCAGLNAEDELAQMDKELIADSERLGIYKRKSVRKKIKGKEKKTFKTPRGLATSIYGESGLEAIRAMNEKAFEEQQREEKRRKRQADEIRQNTGTLQPLNPQQSVELRRPAENSWLKYYQEKSAKESLDAPPEMTITQRLLPSGLLTLAVLMFCLVVPLLYSPPKTSQRLWPDIPPSAATVIGIIAINCAVFVLWRFPPLYQFFNKYAITLPGLPIPLSLIGACFSHQQPGHLALNMVVLFFLGPRLHDEIGRANFLSIYLASGVLGGFASLSNFVLRGVLVTASLGASGAICGVISAFLWLRLDKPVELFGLEALRVPALLPLLVIISFDIIGLRKWQKAPSIIDHVCHLGGYATGIAGAELIKMRMRQKRATELQRSKTEDVENVQGGT